MKTPMALLGRVALAAILTYCVTHFMAFMKGELVSSGEQRNDKYAAAVVFTGAFNRIDRGLDLLRAGSTPHVFISGANPNAGIWLDKFTAQFGRGEPELARLIACCVTYGKIADTTWENAAETACWLRSNRLSGPIALVTSWDHMPRARLTLATLIPASRIVAVPVESEAGDASDTRRLVLEYAKYWAAWLVSWTPRALTSGRYGAFRNGC